MVNSFIYEDEKGFSEKEVGQYFYSKTNSVNDREKVDLKMLREFSKIDDFLFDLTQESLQNNKEKPIKINNWIVYFIYLMLSGNERGQNWTDLEEIIFKNSKLGAIDDLSGGIPSYEKVLNEMKITPKKKQEEFNEMKLLLVTYLEKEKDKCLCKSLVPRKSELSKYGTILNFNYGSTYCIPTSNDISEFWIHGSLDDNENIVFGYDDGMMVEKSIENRHKNARGNLYQYKDELHKQFSKTYQLLNLTTYHQGSKIQDGIRLPVKSGVEYVGILGHGIGAADYNYFETLCDFDKVKIEVFWYEFIYLNSSGEEKMGNNKAELQSSIMKMLQEMEKRLDRVLAHKMLIEQRIIFTKLEYEKI